MVNKILKAIKQYCGMLREKHEECLPFLQEAASKLLIYLSDNYPS